MHNHTEMTMRWRTQRALSRYSDCSATPNRCFFNSVNWSRSFAAFSNSRFFAQAIIGTFRDSLGPDVGIALDVAMWFKLGGALKLAGVQKRVETMLTMTGAQNFLEIHPDASSAIRSFGA